MNIYTIFDTKAQLYGLPFYAQNDPVALRTVVNAMKQPNTDFSMHPEDFLLYRIGSYNTQTGILETEPGTCIAKLIELALKEASN